MHPSMHLGCNRSFKSPGLPSPTGQACAAPCCKLCLGQSTHLPFLLAVPAAFRLPSYGNGQASLALCPLHFQTAVPKETETITPGNRQKLVFRTDITFRTRAPRPRPPPPATPPTGPPPATPRQHSIVFPLFCTSLVVWSDCKPVTMEVRPGSPQQHVDFRLITHHQFIITHLQT